MDMRFGTWNIRSLYRPNSTKWILGKSSLGCGLELTGSGQELVAGSWEQSNTPSGSIKCGKFLEQMTVLTASQGFCSTELVMNILK